MIAGIAQACVRPETIELPHITAGHARALEIRDGVAIHVAAAIFEPVVAAAGCARGLLVHTAASGYQATVPQPRPG